MKSIDFGFLFARVLREYGVDFDALLQMPIRRFWFLNNQIDRLRAEQEIRQLQILACAQSSEGFKASFEHLKTQMGQVYVWQEPKVGEVIIDPQTKLDAEFDRSALQKLKMNITTRR